MILITGGATRIGAAIAKRLAGPGAHIVLHYNQSAAAAEELKTELESKGAKVILWQQDLRAADLAEQFQKLIADVGPIETLINNAAVFYPEKDRPGEMMPELADEIDTINFKAPVTMMREFARQNIKDGNIVNILDQRVLNVSYAFPAYTASKLALWEATKKMATQLSPRIRVNAIAPGHVLPGVGEDENIFRARQAKTPLGMGPSPEEIAEMIALILHSPSMTGACIPMDGGEHLIKKIKI